MISRRHALALAAAAPLAFAPFPARAQQSGGRHVRIGAGIDDAFMQPYYADQLGLFKKLNVDQEIVHAANPGAYAEALAAGAIDIGMVDPTAIAQAYVKGLPFAYFAGGPLSSRDNPTLVLVVGKNSPIKTAKDLEGKTVAIISLHATMEIATREWLTKNGADAAQVKFFELHFPEMTPALTRGTIDAALLGEPFLTENKPDLRAIGVPFDTVAKLFYIFGWFARRDWIASNLDLAHSLATAFYEAGKWANTHRAESAVIEAGITKVDLTTVRTMQRNPLSTSLTASYIQPLLDMAARYKVIERPVNATDLMYPGFS
ncbi:MAG TPA: ABC transporter substrate-binding protein [Candidatus Lustribacter sp.]|jgi:NitT/TauT family transport system substrate-binding protein|nr:ABC transporter substrate-binding protein [Candidatus Lustribacter sp.]